MTQDATFLQRNRHLLENDRQESNLSSVELYFIDFVMAKACFIYRN